MRNQGGEIPHHLKEQWDAVALELQGALKELQDAQERWDAITAHRLEFGGIAGEEECERRRHELSAAYKRYNASIVARTAIMDVLNRGG